jgi:HPt (histidine-containing phosphotransfer) domain-containing protein
MVRPSPGTEQFLDEAALDQLRDVGGDELVIELATLFLSDLDDRVAAIGAAMAEGDNTAASGVAHAVKGASLYLGLSQLADVAKRIELTQRENDQTDAPALLAEINSAAATARQCLESLLTQ